MISATDLSIVPGEILALLGPSGSGKSTMLRMLTGLSTPTAGQVYWHGVPISQAEINVSIVFQSFALFPWLTVLENVEAPLQARGVAPAERRERSMKMLDTVGLDGFEAAYPKELSGGMRQRVGFARALVVEPEVLFMDEPFSALDVLTAENLRSELLELWAKKTMPTKAVFLVTHNIEEAVLLADRIMVWDAIRATFGPTFRCSCRSRATANPRPSRNWWTTSTRCSRSRTWRRPRRRTRRRSRAPRDQRQMRYQMLPHARPGGIAGLLELLLDRGGRDDMYRLADDLAFEIDDLLPIVEAAQMLGFLKVEEGDAAITPSGEEFANSEILRQKELFRNAAIENVLLLRQIRRALDAKSDHTVPEEFFLDMLDEQFSEEESQLQMQTAVTLGPIRRAVRLRLRAAPLCDARRAGRRNCRERRSEVNLQHPLARSLVTVRKTPFLVDLGVAACALALFFAIVSTGVYWFQKPIPIVPISNSIGALPLYAFYSIVRMAIAYVLSLAFAISYGYIAAYNPRIEPWMVAVLDILQSIPVLSFLPPVVLAMVSLIPGHQLGIEMAVILLIFTGQVWNLAFSFYSSLKTIPREMLEASRVFRYSGWQRFWQLEMPFSAIGLVWNSIVSVAGGWFALIFCETFTMGARNFQLPGLGSYIQSATNNGDVHALAGGHRHCDSHRCRHRSTCLAAADCLERKIQIRAGGVSRAGNLANP